MFREEATSTPAGSRAGPLIWSTWNLETKDARQRNAQRKSVPRWFVSRCQVWRWRIIPRSPPCRSEQRNGQESCPSVRKKLNFDNVMTKFIFNKRTDALISICFFTITRSETGQMPGINKFFEVWRVQVAHSHSSARASPSFQILSVCTLIDNKNEPVSAREIGQLL